MAQGGGLTLAASLLLSILGIWNLILTILAGMSRRFPAHRQVSLGIDLIAAAGYFIFQGGFSGPTAWIIILPLFSASLYYEIPGALIMAAILAATQLGFTLYQTLEIKAAMFAGLGSIATFGLAALFGFLSKRLKAHIIKDNLTREENEQKRFMVETERLRAIYKLTSTMMSTLSYQRVIDSLLDLSLAVMNADPDAAPDDRLVGAVLLFRDEKLEVGAARRFTTADLRVSLDAREGVIAHCIEEDKPVLAYAIKNDPDLSRVVALLTCSEVYCIPLRSGFSAYGVLLFGHQERGYFSRDRREMLDTFGRQAVIAIQNARLYQDLVDERDRMFEVQEEARKKLARDLHDGPTQSVAAMAMRLNLTRRMLEKDPQGASDELARIEDMARRTSKEIRHMLFTLRPLVLESQGLVAALKAMADKTKETYQQSVIVQVEEKLLPELEMGKQSVIFFIAEEAVNNSRKHAQAPHIWVNLKSLGQGIVLLEIIDDGTGFDVEAVNRAYDKRGSLGMINLRERTELVNGLLSIQSKPGQGTRVQVYIPLTEESADRLHHSSKRR